MNEELVRKLPFSLIAEQSLLGSILINPEAFNEIADAVSGSDFYMTEHTQIFLAMHELFLTNSEIDVVTLIDMLVMKGVYDKSGGEDYIRTLTEAVPDALNIKDYARIVKEKSVLRQLIAACTEISEAAYSEQESVTDIIDHAENLIFNIAQGRDTKGFRHIKDVNNIVPYETCSSPLQVRFENFFDAHLADYDVKSRVEASAVFAGAPDYAMPLNFIIARDGRKLAVLLVEQNAKKALAIADRAYVLETGNITLSGTGAELAQSDEVRKAYLGG